jgi:hypothetical protein
VIKSHRRAGRLGLGAVAAASLAALSVAGCGGSPSASSSTSANGAGSSAAQGTVAVSGTGKALHACVLLSASKASAIVGQTYTAATESSGGTMCSYKTTTAPIPLFIIITSGANAAAWKDELATMEEDSGSAPLTLTGVGDRAAGSGTEIGVEDGSYIIDVHGGDPSSTGSAFPKSVALAKAIIADLG